jgi:Integrase zinc binding domain
MKQAPEESKRIVRLLLKLPELEITVKHSAGVKMAAADTLSRYVAGAARSEDLFTEIKESHIQTGHRSWNATYELMKRTCSCPNMQQDI